MNVAQRLFLCLGSACLCAAVKDPVWKLATVVEGSALRPSPRLEQPVYAPSGLPVAQVPGVQMMAIQSSQLALIGEKTAYILDKPGETTKVARHGPLHSKSRPGCALFPNRTVMYHHEQKMLYVLDGNGEVCKLPIVAQESLHPEK